MLKKSFVVCAALSVAAVVAVQNSAFAAPMPATSTSKLVAPNLGLFRSPLGFEINAGDSGWIHSQGPRESKFVQTVYRAPEKASGEKNARASLTVRVDKLEKAIPMPKYVQRWQKEYPKYGFDVLGSKPFNQGKMNGYVLDLLNREQQKQIRQVVFMKKNAAVILTCRDDAATFKDTLKGCNQIIRTFDWKQ